LRNEKSFYIAISHNFKILLKPNLIKKYIGAQKTSLISNFNHFRYLKDIEIKFGLLKEKDVFSICGKYYSSNFFSFDTTKKLKSCLQKSYANVKKCICFGNRSCIYQHL